MAAGTKTKIRNRTGSSVDIPTPEGLNADGVEGGRRRAL